jgi:hypothetical protein
MSDKQIPTKLEFSLRKLIQQYGLTDTLYALANVTFAEVEVAKENGKLREFFRIDKVVVPLEEAYFAAEKL